MAVIMMDGGQDLAVVIARTRPQQEVVMPPAAMALLVAIWQRNTISGETGLTVVTVMAAPGMDD